MDKLTIAFPQVKINLDTQNINFESLEQMIFETSQELSRAVAKKALEDLDKMLKAERPEGTLENTGLRIKHFMTRFGNITYERTRYVDSSTGKSRYLLEEKLKISPNQRASLTRQKVEIMLSSVFAYRKAEEAMELFTGHSRSHEATRQSVIREGQRIVEQEKAAVLKTKQLGDPKHEVFSDIAYVEADSTYLKLQRSKKRKHSRRSGKRKRRRSMEVKLGVGYTGKTPRYDKGGRIAQALQNKFSFCDITQGERFMEDLSLIAEKRLGLSRAKLTIVGGDGARWIKNGAQDFFAGSLYVLCRFHLCRNIRRALSWRKESQKEILGLIREDKIDEALLKIQALIQKPKDLKEKKSLQDLHDYIRTNRQGIHAVKHIPDKALRSQAGSTGAIESNIDKFINHRMKKKGMSWSGKGALGLLKVKQLIVNDEWDAWWTRQRSEKIEINLQSFKTLSSKQLWKKSEETNRLLEFDIPALGSRDQTKPWAKVLRELSGEKVLI
jgi:hypothetical protein